tara:strand:- start:4269 stop:5213 length:945 start_codon:yes stop_codon:yes gene_type:complete
MTTKYLNYSDEFYNSYKKFCFKQFNYSKYQSNLTHLAWLNDNKRSNFRIVINDDKDVIGCIHKYKINLATNVGLLEFTVLHDLAVSFNYTGIGQKLLRQELKSYSPLILAHVTGKVAKTYKKIGSKSINSEWRYKLILTLNLFSKKKLYKYLHDENLIINDIKFVNNKNTKSQIFVENLLSKFYKVNDDQDFFDWRFLNKNSPLVFFIFDKDEKALMMMTIGFKSIFPFARIFVTKGNNTEILDKIRISIEKFCALLGITYIISSVINTKQYKFDNYTHLKIQPECFWYEDKNKNINTVELDGSMTDLAFNGYW